MPETMSKYVETLWRICIHEQFGKVRFNLENKILSLKRLATSCFYFNVKSMNIKINWRTLFEEEDAAPIWWNGWLKPLTLLRRLRWRKIIPVCVTNRRTNEGTSAFLELLLKLKRSMKKYISRQNVCVSWAAVKPEASDSLDSQTV